MGFHLCLSFCSIASEDDEKWFVQIAQKSESVYQMELSCVWQSENKCNRWKFAKVQSSCTCLLRHQYKRKYTFHWYAYRQELFVLVYYVYRTKPHRILCFVYSRCVGVDWDVVMMNANTTTQLEENTKRWLVIVFRTQNESFFSWMGALGVVMLSLSIYVSATAQVVSRWWCKTTGFSHS